MRHYYRFMELEPVMEQEEDSAGEASPTPSSGSPSLSPPPDAWAQLSGKEYHDALSNHLLQEHLELQRAYRMLEMQYRNCDTRASRDMQRLKEVLPNQERLREELQRAKERETALRGEIYDLQEQNELLEFRILELGECHENASLRGVIPETRDIATETSFGDVRDFGSAALQIGDKMDNVAGGLQVSLIDAPQTPFSAAGKWEATCGREPQQTSTLERQEDSSQCRTSVSQRDENAHNTWSVSPDNRTDHEQCTSHHNTQQEHQTCQPEQRPESTKEISSLNSTQTEAQTIASKATEDHPFSSNALTSLSESISCTLCRSLPRRRSFPALSKLSNVDCDSTEVENLKEKELLRKSKSDGEIQKRYCSNQQEVCKSSEKGNAHANLRVKENAEMDSFDEEHCSKLALSNVQCLVEKEGLDPIGGRIGEGKSPWRDNRNSTRVEDQVKTMRSMLNAIYEVLRETRVEVECTNSELREEVQTLETTVQRLTEEVTRRGGATSKEESTGTRGTTAPPLVRRSRSLSFSKDCYCCTQELKPSLEDVISKLQQLMHLIIDTEPITTARSLVVQAEEPASSEEVNGDVRKASAPVQPTVETNCILPVASEENKSVALQRKVLETLLTAQKGTTAVEVLSVSKDDKTKRRIVQHEIQTKDKMVVSMKKQAKATVQESIKDTFKEGCNPKLPQVMWESAPSLPAQDSKNKTPQSPEREVLSNKPSEGNTNVEEVIPENIVEKATEFFNSNSVKCFGKSSDAEEEETEEVCKEKIDPLPEEKTKPVLRRWREQLIVRRDRVQPWRIELLDFPKRQPSVV